MSWFSRKRPEVVALIDVGAHAIEGALVSCVVGQAPVVIYAVTARISFSHEEDQTQAMFRTLVQIISAMREQGEGALLRMLGRVTIERVLVAMDAPWLETHLYTKNVAPGKPFVFTKDIVQNAIARATVLENAMCETDACVVATVLDGYEVRQPYGKKVQNVSLTVLASQTDVALREHVISIVQDLQKGARVSIIAGTSLRYQALRTLFPHEQEVLVVDVTGPLPTFLLVRRGVLVGVSDTPRLISLDREVTGEDLHQAMSTLMQKYPLPTTVFLLTRTDKVDAHVALLRSVRYDTVAGRAHTPKIIPVMNSALKGMLHAATIEVPDLPVLLMGLYVGYIETPVRKE